MTKVSPLMYHVLEQENSTRGAGWEARRGHTARTHIRSGHRPAVGFSCSTPLVAMPRHLATPCGYQREQASICPQRERPLASQAATRVTRLGDAVTDDEVP